jgi:hypothetical protein
MRSLFIKEEDELIYRGFHLLVSLVIMLIYLFCFKRPKERFSNSIIMRTSWIRE